MDEAWSALRRIARLLEVEVEPYFPELEHYIVECVVGAVERLKEQLPSGMQHCTIQYIVCEKGHGRLTAKNWVTHECFVCKSERLCEEVKRQDCEPQLLGEKIPDFWYEAKTAWPWLPETTERLDDEWRNRTRAANAIWLMEQAERRIKELEAVGEEIVTAIMKRKPELRGRISVLDTARVIDAWAGRFKELEKANWQLQQNAVARDRDRDEEGR